MADVVVADMVCGRCGTDPYMIHRVQVASGYQISHWSYRRVIQATVYSTLNQKNLFTRYTIIGLPTVAPLSYALSCIIFRSSVRPSDRLFVHPVFALYSRTEKRRKLIVQMFPMSYLSLKIKIKVTKPQKSRHKMHCN